MPRVRCQYDDCEYLENNFCTAARIEMDIDKGCLTYSPEYLQKDNEDLDLADDDDVETWDEWEDDQEEGIIMDDDEW